MQVSVRSIVSIACCLVAFSFSQAQDDGDLLKELIEKAKLGDVTAQTKLGEVYAKGEVVPQNVNWAIKSEYAGLLFDQPAKQPPAKDRDAILENVKKALCFIQVTE